MLGNVCLNTRDWVGEGVRQRETPPPPPGEGGGMPHTFPPPPKPPPDEPGMLAVDTKMSEISEEPGETMWVLCRSISRTLTNPVTGQTS